MIECAFGILKNRFRCLLDKMELEPAFACEVFKACCVLHNMMLTPQDVRDAESMLVDNEAEDAVSVVCYLHVFYLKHMMSIYIYIYTHPFKHVCTADSFTCIAVISTLGIMVCSRECLAFPISTHYTLRIRSQLLR